MPAALHYHHLLAEFVIGLLLQNRYQGCGREKLVRLLHRVFAIMHGSQISLTASAECLTCMPDENQITVQLKYQIPSLIYFCLTVMERVSVLQKDLDYEQYRILLHQYYTRVICMIWPILKGPLALNAKIQTALCIHL